MKTPDYIVDGDEDDMPDCSLVEPEINMDMGPPRDEDGHELHNVDIV